ncbi:TetR/AcrR family transcriptional regulator [Aeromicrobium sp.]|uniref:TetR/AcrR family transcriptional regulator n=1 Tax=Aeromicrobium sp. TaxID=1871063 RepID=UPI0028B137F2|nr:TetR/AcrR family transcriptional regulator [Aeromicrobium sp.]
MSTPETPAAAGGSSSRGRPSVRRELVEQRIFDEATRLFAERGFAGTGFQDIADAVGLTRPALYHYFPSKDDLLARIVVGSTDDSAREMEAVLERTDLDAAEKLHRVVALTVRRNARQPERLRLLIRSESDLPEAIAARHREGRRTVLRLLVNMIERGIADGLFRPVDARVAALGIIGTMNWVAWWYDPLGSEDLTALADQLADQAVAGLLDPTRDAAAGGGPLAAIATLRATLDRLERTLTT